MVLHHAGRATAPHLAGIVALTPTSYQIGFHAIARLAKHCTMYHVAVSIECSFSIKSLARGYAVYLLMVTCQDSF